MWRLPPNHPERFILADEVHARPYEPMQAPSRASHVAVLLEADAREREWAHLCQLCESCGVRPPMASDTHFSATLFGLRLKWERHGEFSSYTFMASGLPQEPFSEPPLARLPPQWLAGIPGLTLVCAQLVCAQAVPEPGPVEASEDFRGAPDWASYFQPSSLVGSRIAQGEAEVMADFRIHDDGAVRFALINRGLSPRQLGQMAQRLFEIEAYRMLALLALPMARRQSPRILEIEKALARLTDGISQERGQDETLLQELTRLAAEVESGLAASQFRFGACRAYADLVDTRIQELREERSPGWPMLGEFMARRFTPAVRTCAAVSQRMHDLSERVAQASALLSTRVDIARERQNQALLASMDRRAKLQLRLQQTVEGLSVAAIAYYLVGLSAYGFKALKAAGLPLDLDLALGLAVLPVAAGVWVAVHRARRHLAQREPERLLGAAVRQ